MKALYIFFAITFASISFAQDEVSDTLDTSISPLISVDSTTLDSAMMSHAEIYDYYYIKEFKLPQCRITVDSMQKQIIVMNDQIVDQRLQIQDLSQAFMSQKKITKEKDIQLNIEQAKNRKKTWAIIGGVAGGLVVGFITCFLIKN